MSTTYAQWRASADKAEARRCIYLCGPETALRQEVIETTISIVNPSHLDYVSVDADHAATADIWADANAYPLTPNASRLVVVRNAQNLRDWTPLESWLNTVRRRPSTYLLFVSEDAEVPDAPHITLLRKRSHGQVVRCTRPNPTDLTAWVRRRAGLDVEMATRLLDNVHWNVADAADACRKLALFGGNPGPATVDAVCNPGPGNLVEFLLADEKVQALGAVHQLDQAALGLLAARVDLLGRMWAYAKAGVPAREIRDVPPFILVRYMQLVSRWNPKRCDHARRVLAVVEDAYRSGARDAIGEALVALW